MGRASRFERKRGRQRAQGSSAGTQAGDDGEGEQVRMKEAYLRMSYLYQASHLVALSGPSCLPLSRFYAATMKKIGSRLVIRSHPSVKGAVCKVCHTLLIPTPPSQRSENASSLHDTSSALATSTSSSSSSSSSSPPALSLSSFGCRVELQPSASEWRLTRICRCCGTARRVSTRKERLTIPLEEMMDSKGDSEAEKELHIEADQPHPKRPRTDPTPMDPQPLSGASPTSSAAASSFSASSADDLPLPSPLTSAEAAAGT